MKHAKRLIDCILFLGCSGNNVGMANIATTAGFCCAGKKHAVNRCDVNITSRLLTRLFNLYLGYLTQLKANECSQIKNYHRLDSLNFLRLLLL